MGRIAEHWCGNRQLADSGFQVPREPLLAALESSRHLLDDAPDNTALLAEEARLTKKLFKFAVNAVDYGDFTRAKKGTGTDPANRFLDHGNYLAYGLGATAAWVLSLPDRQLRKGRPGESCHAGRRSLPDRQLRW